MFYGFNVVQKVTIRGRRLNVLQFTLRVVYHQSNQPLEGEKFKAQNYTAGF